MIIEETFTIEAPIQDVWDFFFDLDRISRCVPGAEVQQVDAENYEGTLSVKVGPLGASFSGTVIITQQTPPSQLEAALKAKDKNTASMVQGKFTSTLKDLSPRQTEVSYQIDVSIRGKLGQFGQTVIQDTAKRISAEFLTCVKGQIEVAEGEAPPPAPTMDEAGGVATRAFFGALIKAVVDWFRGVFGGKASDEQRHS